MKKKDFNPILSIVMIVQNSTIATSDPNGESLDITNDETAPGTGAPARQGATPTTVTVPFPKVMRN